MNELELQLRDAEGHNRSLAQAIGAIPAASVTAELRALKAAAEAEVERLRTLIRESNACNSFYNTMLSHSKYAVTDEFKTCVETAVDALMDEGERASEPVLLLGKVQSGKTNAFEYIVANCLDRGMEIIIVLTKNSTALAEQTLSRLQGDFQCIKLNDGADDNDIYDIMRMGRISASEARDHRIMIILKKEDDNLRRLIQLFEDRSELLNRRVLIVDDEADFASRGFTKDQLAELQGCEITKKLAVIPELLEKFKAMAHNYRYLQVTATPYALYLQPDETIELNGSVIPCFKPRKTVAVPVHSGYIGGKQYFEESQNQDSMYSHLHCALSDKCCHVLDQKDDKGKSRKATAAYLTSSLQSENIRDLRGAMIHYLMATAIRFLQESPTIYKSCCIIHVSTSQANHAWQEKLVNSVLLAIGKEIAENRQTAIRDEINSVYADFVESNRKGQAEGLVHKAIPTQHDVEDKMRDILNENYEVKLVNSNNDVKKLLNSSGELRLSSIATIFIGGNVLDRGITVSNLLTFVYGRQSTTQMDTAMQHARMYGARSKEDMTVTRFYTTDAIYQRLKKMHNFDENLRERMLAGEDVDVFIESDTDVKPTSKSRIALSNINAIKSNQRILPSGMQTGYKTYIQPTIDEIDRIIETSSNYKKDDFFEIPVSDVVEIIRKIRTTYEYNDTKADCMNASMDWDINDMLRPLMYATEKSVDGMMWCLHRTNRKISRKRADGRIWVDSPDSGSMDTTPAKNIATDKPCIILLKEQGLKENGWRDAEFYWPVLILQKNIRSAIYELTNRA